MPSTIQSLVEPSAAAGDFPGQDTSVALSSPRVSVLIPTYNYARYLPEAIESVLDQDFQDYEILIVDDCSPDESEAVIRRYAARDSRIRCHFNRPNLGMVANWNYCLSQARGEYIKFLFGDDKLADRRALTKMVRMLDENPSAVLAVTARNIIDENSRILEISDKLGANGVQRGLEVIIRCLERNANIIGEPSVVMLRRQAASRGFNRQFRQLTDLEMWFHLLEDGDVVYTNEPLCAFRRHATQQTEVNRASQIGEREYLTLLAEYYARPWLRNQKRRKMLFRQLYWLRAKQAFGEDSLELEERMMKSLGAGWYAWLWFCRKATRPFSNSKRFYLKHVLGRPVK
ncbi:MAG: hypothetical protein JWR19_4353 [Pedosphaera sp.]|nr:hypothetical protein [Pedosphaera sp.]